MIDDKPKWRECAYEACGKIFAPDDRDGGTRRQGCCSHRCARLLQWEQKSPQRFAAKFATFLQQPEVGDRATQIERAFWRVFGS